MEKPDELKLEDNASHLWKRLLSVLYMSVKPFKKTGTHGKRQKCIYCKQEVILN